MKWIKNNVKLIIISLFILFLLPIILNYILKKSSIIGVFDKSDFGVWVGYYSAILGGSLTLLGVYGTIKNQEISNKKDKAIQLKPILDLTSDSELPSTMPYRETSLIVKEYSKKQTDPSNYVFKNETEKESFFYILKNKGRGETSKAILEKLEITDKDINWIEKDDLYCPYSESYIGEIISNEHCKIIIHFPRYLLIKKEIGINESLELNVKMKIKYNDMFDHNTYRYSVYLRFSISLDSAGYEDINNVYYACKASYELMQIMPYREKLEK